MYSVLHKPQLLFLITTATRPFLMVWNPPRALIVFHVHFNANYAVMQLRKITFLSERVDSNHRPIAYQASALPTELRSVVVYCFKELPRLQRTKKPILDFILLGGQDSNLHYGHPKH